MWNSVISFKGSSSVLQITLVTITVSGLIGCGGGSASTSQNQASIPTVNIEQTTEDQTNDSSPSIGVERVFQGLSFDEPVAMIQEPENFTSWYIVEKKGIVRRFINEPDATTSDVFLNLTDRVNSEGYETGLLGMTFHPDFPESPEIFVTYTATGDLLTSRVSRLTLNSITGLPDQNSEEILLTINQPYSNHNGGAIVFGPDKFLYTSLGDGGSGGDPEDNGQNPRTLLGTVLRIDVDAALETDVTFRQIQKHIFDVSCVTSGCHDASTSTAGLSLESPGTYQRLVEVPSTQDASRFLIETNNPEESYLLNKIQGGTGSGARMPSGLPPLGDELINRVRAWIQAGAPTTQYAIPRNNFFEGNPICPQGKGELECPEIYSWGLRNVWRMNFDNNGSHLWAGDVGQNNWEEVDRLVSGGNYGWNEREGAHCYDPATNCATDFQEPITEYDHSIGQSITGGFVYSGIEISTLDGWYVFGDFISGTVLAIPENSVPTVTPSIIGSTNMNISSFAQDENGELYILDFYTGTVHKIVAAP